MPAKQAPFRVAIVGRPNVGKSTLFNRLVGQRLALVDDLPGSRATAARARRGSATCVSPPSIPPVSTRRRPRSLAGRMRAQTEAAVRSADLNLFLVDARTGLTPLDSHFAELLRSSGKPVVLVANKAEGSAGAAGSAGSL